MPPISDYFGVLCLSFPRKRESSRQSHAERAQKRFLDWIPAFAGITANIFYLTTLLSSHALAGTAPLNYHQQDIMLGDFPLQVRVPTGYTLDLLNHELQAPRMLTFAPNGDLFAGSRAGHVYRFKPPYTSAETLVTLSGYPHSVAFRPGEILIAQTDGLYRASWKDDQQKISPGDVQLMAKLPGGRGHDSRTVAIGPDGRIYASLGISGNCSDQYIGGEYPFAERRGGILVLNEKNKQWEGFASGLRNPVDFDWHPNTNVLYAASHGPDHLGYHQPPEYFSRLDAGSFHGMPWFQYDGKQLRRDDCINSAPPLPLAEVTPPAVIFPARNGPMGMTFVTANTLDATLQGDAVVALHGSWATQPDGGGSGDPATRRDPKLVAVRFDNGKPVRVDDLVTGFQLPDGRRWARPAGVATGPDGALYFTSDAGINGLFRLSRTR